MGVWNLGLFSNDTMSDIRDTYIALLRQKTSDEEAYQKTYEEYIDLLGTDEEALLWYALADTQWNLGRLMPHVKLKALECISRKEGILFEDNDKASTSRWDRTLDKLAEKINSSMPPRKRIYGAKEFVRNPWNVGDIYVYKFHSGISKTYGLYGKYIAFQKMGDAKSFDNLTFSVVQIYDKIFETPPSVDDLRDTRILPLVYPPNIGGTPCNINDYSPSFGWYMRAIMLCDNKKDYPDKFLVFVGNKKTPYMCYCGNDFSELYWDNNHMEDWLVDYHIQWRNLEY